MSIDFVEPTKGTISIPEGMTTSTQFTSLRGLWCSPDGTPTQHMNFTDRSRILLLLGLVHSLENKVDKLGVAEPGPAGPGTSDIGQVTYDGRSGLAITIQLLWPDSERNSNQLYKEIQWLVNQGFKALKDEWKDSETLLEKLMAFAAISMEQEE